MLVTKIEPPQDAVETRRMNARSEPTLHLSTITMNEIRINEDLITCISLTNTVSVP